MDYSPFVSGTELRLIVPMAVVTIVAIAVLLLQVFHRSRASRRYLAWMSILGLGVAGLVERRAGVSLVLYPPPLRADCSFHD